MIYMQFWRGSQREVQRLVRVHRQSKARPSCCCDDAKLRHARSKRSL